MHAHKKSLFPWGLGGFHTHKMEQKLQELQQKTPKASLFNLWVTSSHAYSLQTPKLLEDYEEREQILNSKPFARLLLKRGLKPKTLVNLLRCGSYSSNGKLLKTSCGCGSVIGKIRHHCSNRSCPKCSERRRRKIFRKYYPLIRNLPATSTHSLKFLTISPKNYTTLQEGQENLRKSLSKMFRNKYFKDRITAGFYVVETKSSEKGWNVHAHIIIYSKFLNNYLYSFCPNCQKKRRVKFDKRSKKYYCSIRTCNSIQVNQKVENSLIVDKINTIFQRQCMVDVKLIKSRMSPYGQLTSNQHALNYCLKYVSHNKGDFKNETDFADYIVYTSNRRLINVFGIFHNFKNDPIKPKCTFCFQYFKTELISETDYLQQLKPPPIDKNSSQTI